MGRRKAPKRSPVRAAPKAKAIDATHFINGGLIVIVALLAMFSFWVANQFRHTLAYAEAGMAACAERFNVDYLNACNVQADGVACQHETRSRLKDWYLEVDYRCAKAGPDVVFVARINEPPPPEDFEVAEAQ